MGCDIHIFLERKNSKNQWVDSMVYKNDPYVGFRPLSHYARSYTLFATLAGVRGDDPIEYPKGIPEDCSLEYKKLCDVWEGDGHSHSYFTLRELLDAAPSCSELRKDQLYEFISHLKSIIKVQDYWVDDKEIDDNAEKYRVCFFFDN